MDIGDFEHIRSNIENLLFKQENRENEGVKMIKSNKSNYNNS